MNKRKLLWHLYPYFFAISLVSILLVSWYAVRLLYRSHMERTSIELLGRTQLLNNQFIPLILDENKEAVQLLCKQLGARSGTRITIIRPDGTVIGDSSEAPALMDNHRDRPEISAALRGEQGLSRRYSPTVRREMFYAAIPIQWNGGIIGVARTSMPAMTVEAAFRTLRIELFSLAMLLLLLTGVGSYALARRISRPLQEMKQAAERFAVGDLSGRVPVPNSEEIGSLAEALNSLALQLGDKISQLEQQRNEQIAVFGSMVESVIALDKEERILHMNESAVRLFGASLQSARGRRLYEVIRNPDLQRFVRRTLDSRSPVEGDLVLHNEGDRYLQAHGTALRDAHEQPLGILIVLNDVTRLRRLENVRRDFVANVSHELKTPITSIKGFVETLADGAVNKPEETQRFLGIIAKQADRLNSIIEDLLSLSRIEQDAEHGQIQVQRQPLKPVLKAAVELCQMKARDKQVAVTLDCENDLAAWFAPALLEQALVNLIDNAVKYSNAAATVEVRAAGRENEVLISVQDHGCGIEREHIPRLFERFYRVDKARSRQLGGTGLGLSIVKHIVQAHGARISVESTPGEGSTFTITLTDPGEHTPPLGARSPAG